MNDTDDFFVNSVLLDPELIEIEEESEDEPDLDLNYEQIMHHVMGTKTSEQLSLERDIDVSCSACGGELGQDLQGGVMVCMNPECGMIEEDILDLGAEWRSFNSGEGTRCGCPSNYFFPQSSTGTIVTGLSNHRLRVKQQWNAGDYRGQRLSDVFGFITKICMRSNLSRSVIDDAKIYYKNLSECKHIKGKNKGKYIIIRGDNVTNIIAACVSKACEKNRCSMDSKEIGEVFRIKDSRVTSGKKKFDKIIDNTENPNENPFKNELSNITADFDITEDYITRHSAPLGMGASAKELALTIARNCWRSRQASDHSARSLAGGIVLLLFARCGTGNINKRKTRIAKQFGISEATITKVYVQIDFLYEMLIDDDLTTFVMENYESIAEKWHEKLNKGSD